MRRPISAGLLLLGFLSIVPSRADTIKLAADSWMPYNGDGKTEIGYFLDVAKKVFGDAGHTLVFEAMPWARAIDSARKGTVNGIVGAVEDDAPDFIFPRNELAMVNTEFFVKKGNPWRFKGIESLKKIRLSVIKEYAYYGELDAYIKENQNSKDRLDIAFGDNPLEDNFQKLIGGRVDVIVDGGAVLKYTANSMKVTAEVESAGIGSPGSPTYIAFSPTLGTSRKYAELLSDGIDRLRKSGELKKILAAYGLTDWK
jgi:polar amino acid transport system substrate-binding protein